MIDSKIYSIDNFDNGLYVKPCRLLLPRLGGQGSGSKETGTFWGGYGGGEQPAPVAAVTSPANARA